MLPRHVLRSVLCVTCVVAGWLVAAARPEWWPHPAWAGVTLAVAVFLVDPPQVTIRLGLGKRLQELQAAEARVASIQEQARLAELKDHALRERERRLRERESRLLDRESAVLRRENDLAVEWARLRAEASRRGHAVGGPSASEGRAPVTMGPEEWLGVPRGASPDEVRKAWIALAKAFHPDRMRDLPPWAREDADRRMKAINEAYELLRR